MNRYNCIVTLLLAGAAFPAVPDISRVNGSISVASGQSAGNVSTVNGAIRLDDNVTIAHASTVNGGISLGNASSAETLNTVNGAIHIGDRGHVSGAVATVNGSVTLGRSADISGRLFNVNGHIGLNAAHVGGGIETVSGAIDVGAGSRVEGGIFVHKCSRGWVDVLFLSNRCEPPLVVIGPGAIVKGSLRFEREVKLYVSDRATVGPVVGAKAIVYFGAYPIL